MPKNSRVLSKLRMMGAACLFVAGGVVVVNWLVALPTKTKASPEAYADIIHLAMMVINYHTLSSERLPIVDDADASDDFLAFLYSWGISNGFKDSYSPLWQSSGKFVDVWTNQYSLRTYDKSESASSARRVTPTAFALKSLGPNGQDNHDNGDDLTIVRELATFGNAQ